MKILQVINDLSMGGAEKLVVEICKILKIRGYYSDILLLNDKKNVFKYELINSGIKIQTLNSKNKYSILNLFKLLRIARNYDIIHSHLFPSNYWVALLRFFYKKKILLTTEHNTFNKRRRHFFFRILDSFIYRKYDKIITISKGTENSLKKWLMGNRKYNIITINNGINIGEIKVAKTYNKEDFFSRNDFILVMVGSFTEQKNQECVIKALRFLPNTFKLLLVGDGYNKNYLEKLVEDLNLSERVKFLGIRKDVYSILKVSDVIIISSNWEGFGLVAVEGMAAGKPVIASNVDGLREVVGGAGILFEKNNSKELSTKIYQIFKNKTLYNEVLNKCVKRAEKYDLKLMVDEYLRLYQEEVKNIKK